MSNLSGLMKSVQNFLATSDVKQHACCSGSSIDPTHIEGSSKGKNIAGHGSDAAEQPGYIGMQSGGDDGSGQGSESAKQTEPIGVHPGAIHHRFDKLQSDVRPYAMMTRTCYMEYDPMNDRGMVPGIYARSISSVIGNRIFLQDINLNQIQVAVERTKTEMYFTHGCSRLRHFYNIGAGAWLTLLYVSPFVLFLKIRNIDGIEIAYPSNNPPSRLLLDEKLPTTNWDAPIPFFVLPSKYTHMLEKTLTASDVFDGALTIFWRGFCQQAIPPRDAQLTLIDWIGNRWDECHFQNDAHTNMSCKISGQWKDICKVHRLAEGVVVKFGVT